MTSSSVRYHDCAANPALSLVIRAAGGVKAVLTLQLVHHANHLTATGKSPYAQFVGPSPVRPKITAAQIARKRMEKIYEHLGMTVSRGGHLHRLRLYQHRP